MSAAFVLTLSLSSLLVDLRGGYGMDFRAFMLTLISLFFSVYAPSKIASSLFAVYFFKIRNTVMVVHLKNLDVCLFYTCRPSLLS